MPSKKSVAEKPLVEVTEPDYGETDKSSTRAETRRASANGGNVLEAVATLERLNEVLYMNDLAEVKLLNSVQVDNLASELIAVRKAKDIVEGREASLKKYATDVINLKIENDGENPDEFGGYLVSPENGVKLSKEVSAGKLNVDINELKKILDDDQFFSVVNTVTTKITTIVPGGGNKVEESTVYEINEECLEKQLLAGNIGMEQILKASIPGKTRTAFYVRAL